MLRISLLITALILSVPTCAQTLTAQDPSLIAELLRVEGYRAELMPAKTDQNPRIESAASGANFDLIFLDCKERKDCKAVQYWAAFTKPKIDLAKINEWNRDKRFVRAYLDKEGDAILEMDVNMAPEGMPRSLFVDNLGVWDQLIGEFYKFVFPK